MAWRVPAKQPIGKAIVSVLLLVVAVAVGDGIAIIISVFVAGLLAVLAVRDIRVPVRLTADGAGITVVSGWARRQQLAWADIDRIRVDRQRRLIGHHTTVEIDAGKRLYFLSASDLGQPCAEVVTALSALRSRSQ